MKQKKLLYLKDKAMPLFLLTLLLLYLIGLRYGANDRETSFMERYYQSYNERRFLSLYLSAFLLSLFPVIKNFYITERLIRCNRIYAYVISIVKQIGVMALLYTVVLVIGWFDLVGSKTKDWMTGASILYISIIFFTQLIGWFLIGILEGFVYIMIKSLPLTFIICETLLIVTNLSLYISDNKLLVQYIRLYDFMFDLSKMGNFLTIFSIGFFNIAVITALVGLSYHVLRRHDFIPGGKRLYGK